MGFVSKSIFSLVLSRPYPLQACERSDKVPKSQPCAQDGSGGLNVADQQDRISRVPQTRDPPAQQWAA